MTEQSFPRSGEIDAVCASISRLVSASPGAVRRVRVCANDIEVEMEWTAGPAIPDGFDAPPTAPPAIEAAAPPAGVHHILAPLVGTFYRAPEPGAKPFVETDDVVVPGQQVGLVEVMKMMIAVEADQPGCVVDFLVANAEPVEYGQPLIALAASDE